MGGAVLRWLRVPGLDAPPEFVHWRIEEVQCDTDTDAASYGSHLVALDPPREPEVNGATGSGPGAQSILGELPEFVVAPVAWAVVAHGVGPKAKS